jgi:branched-chain amino acid transport system substrate-binding protein
MLAFLFAPHWRHKEQSMTYQRIDRRTSLKMLAGAALGMAAPAFVRAAPAEIPIGILVALTGPNGAWGQTAWEGAQLACDLINQQGGVKAMGGAKLKPVVADTESKPQVASSQAEKLIRLGVVTMLGTNQSAATNIATQICERRSLPFLIPSDIDPLTTARGFKYTFRFCPLMKHYAHDILAYAKRLSEASGKPVKTLAILSENTAPGKASADAIKAALPQFDYELVDISMYDSPQTQNFSSYIAKYKAAGVDVLLGHNRPADGVAIVRTMKELNYVPKFAGGLLGGHDSREFMDTLGPDADGIFGSGGYSPTVNLPVVAQVVQEFQKRFNKGMDATAANMVSGISVVWDALERTKSLEGPALRDALAATNIAMGSRYYMTANGVKFDAIGENSKAEAIIVMIKDRIAQAVSPESFASIKGVYPKAPWRV